MSTQPEPVFLRNIAHTDAPVYVSGVACTGTTTAYSKGTSPGRNGLITWQVTADADAAQSLVGTFTVEESNSTETEFARGVEKWTTHARALPVAIPAINLASGAATTFFIEVIDGGAFKYRLKFVQDSGQGYIYANVRAS